MIRLEKVVKEFGGPLARLRGERVRALDGVTLHVPPGAAVGLVGPNGAGKSTLIRLLLGYLAPTRGGVQVGGMLPRDFAERRGVAYVPDRVALPPGWTVGGALHAFAALGEVERPAERVQRVMRKLGLTELAGRRVSALSKGNLQRLGIAQALLGDRKVMVMDEGTDGLDPEWVARVRDMLAEWRRADPERVLVYASHDLDEVERVADQAIVLSEGRVREVVDLRGGGGPRPSYRLEVEGAECARRVAGAFPGALPVAGAAHAFRVEAGGARDLTRRLEALIGAGAILRSVTPEAGGSLRDRYRGGLSWRTAGTSRVSGIVESAAEVEDGPDTAADATQRKEGRMIPVLLRGLLPRLGLVALLCVAFYFLEPGFHTHDAPASEEFSLDLGYLGIAASLANLAGLSMLVLLGGFISNDRRQGYYRLYFAHPTRPIAFYGVRWVLGLGLSMVATTVFLVLGQVAAWGQFEGGWSGLFLALLAAVAYGGMIAFLSVALTRGDTWVALVLFLFNYFWLYAVSLGVQPLPPLLNDAVSILLPPQLALGDVYDGLLRGEIVWGASAFAAGYGVFWLLMAGLLLRLRDWP